MNQLSNQTAIITGAASGMGKAMAILFAAEGARVVAADLHQAELDTVVESIRQSGGTAIGIPCNVSLESDIRSLIAGAMEHFGSVDILVNNAGVMDDFHPVEHVSNDVWNKVLRIGPSLKAGATSAHDVEMYYLPVQCQHCENPACMVDCPTGA